MRDDGVKAFSKVLPGRMHVISPGKKYITFKHPIRKTRVLSYKKNFS